MTTDEALKKMQAVKSYMTSGNPIWSVTEIGEAFDMAIKALEQPERNTGEWIPHKSIFGGLGEPVYTCDQCGHNIGFHRENFCPSCGAKMEGVQP